MEDLLDTMELSEEEQIQRMIDAEGEQDELGEGSVDELEDEPEDEDIPDEPQVQDEQVPEPEAQVPATGPTNEALLALIAGFQEELAKLRANPPKNQVEGKPGNKVYARLGEFTGKAPRQQQNLAAILTANMPIGEKFTEEQVFKVLVAAEPNYESLRESKQDVTYLFRYYRGLKDTGFVKRGFLAVS